MGTAKAVLQKRKRQAKAAQTRCLFCIAHLSSKVWDSLFRRVERQNFSGISPRGKAAS
jgi:hypothetical protein